MSLFYSNMNEHGQKLELEQGTTILGKSVRFRITLDTSYPDQSSAVSHVWIHELGWTLVASYAWQEWARKDSGQTSGADKAGMALCELECRTDEILSGR